METAPIPAPPPPSFTGRFFRFLRARPILVLLFFSPGLIEYLSGSSPLALVALNPTFFVFQLLINVGLYGPGVLLIREAMIRWMKGWATVLLLGVAYGILEEGVALSTMFNSLSGPAASAGLGTYGHFFGVDWVWALQISIVHALFSISIPIMLLGLALPETRGRSLLTGRGIMLALGVWGVEIPLLILLVRQWSGFFAGLPLILGSLGVIAILVLAAGGAEGHHRAEDHPPECTHRGLLRRGLGVPPGRDSGGGPPPGHWPPALVRHGGHAGSGGSVALVGPPEHRNRAQRDCPAGPGRGAVHHHYVRWCAVPDRPANHSGG